MRLVMVAGSHPRHIYIAEQLLKSGYLKGLIIQKREPMIKEPDIELTGKIRELYEYHFNLRNDIEAKYFGAANLNYIKDCIPTIEIERENLNKENTINFINLVGADTIVSYGPDLFGKEIIDLCPGRIFNIHGGLSPYYKGAATMFWPFYFLEPNYVGTTIHHITSKIDAGNIIHQSVPKMEYGDCMHEVACKAIVQTALDLEKVLDELDKLQFVEGVVQKKNGKLFLDKDWRPEHLTLIYETYKDKIVDMYLDGIISKGNEPKLVRLF